MERQKALKLGKVFGEIFEKEWEIMRKASGFAVLVEFVSFVGFFFFILFCGSSSWRSYVCAIRCLLTCRTEHWLSIHLLVKVRCNLTA